MSLFFTFELFFQVLIALMLFFGHLRTSMNHNEFVSALAGIGVIGAVHMFSWLVVFQFRKNLMEEQRFLARLVASAPLPPGWSWSFYKCLAHVFFQELIKFIVLTYVKFIFFGRAAYKITIIRI